MTRKQTKNVKTFGAPGLTPEQLQVANKLEDEVRLQPRRVRAKNFGYLMLFMAWNVTVITFIMYRLRSDDLDQLEKEAYERIRISNLGESPAAKRRE